MTPRVRVYAVVAAAAAVVAVAVVGVTWLQARGESTTAAGAVARPRPGIPPLFFDFGVRSDAEARALATGAQLLKNGRRAQAAAIFGRYHSVQAQLGSAFAAWPKGSLDEVKHLLAIHPDDPVVNLQYAVALYWSGRNADAVKQFQAVDSKFPDSASAVQSEDILYASRFPIPGLPYMLAPVQLPSASTLAEQLRKAKASPLAYGVMLWRLDRRISARRALDEAAARAPGDPVVLTLDAVAHFTKKDPTAAFSRLGPLSGRFPKAAVVRLELGILLLWQKQVAKAEAQFRIAVRDEPHSVYAGEAKTLLSRLGGSGTK